jgi:predicted nucleic-acid-binding protein
MIAFDTNYLLRHILQDDARQCASVQSILDAQAEVLIMNLVIMETFWVLQKVYRLNREGCCHVLESLLSDRAFKFENSGLLRRAMELYRAGKADFNDYFILAQAEFLGADLKTFDKKLKQSL